MSKSRGTEKRERSRILSVRLSPEEKNILEAKSSRCGLPLGRFMRDAAMGRKILNREEQKLRADLGRLGGLFKLAITMDHLAAYRPEFKNILEQIRGHVERMGREDDHKGNTAEKE